MRYCECTSPPILRSPIYRLGFNRRGVVRGVGRSVIFAVTSRVIMYTSESS